MKQKGLIEVHFKALRDMLAARELSVNNEVIVFPSRDILWMCVYIQYHMHVFTCIYIYIYIYAYIYIYIYIHMYIYTCIYIFSPDSVSLSRYNMHVCIYSISYTCVYVHIYIYMFSLLMCNADVCIGTVYSDTMNTYPYGRANIHHKHTHMHIYMHSPKRIHARTHTQTQTKT